MCKTIISGKVVIFGVDLPVARLGESKGPVQAGSMSGRQVFGDEAGHHQGAHGEESQTECVVMDHGGVAWQLVGILFGIGLVGVAVDAGFAAGLREGLRRMAWGPNQIAWVPQCVVAGMDDCTDVAG